MILQCPQCNARFAVPDAQIPPQGRTVRCGRCHYQWHADAPRVDEVDDWDPLSMPQATPVVPEDGMSTESFEEALNEAHDEFSDEPIVEPGIDPMDPIEPPPPAEHQVPSLQPWEISRVPFMVATPLLILLFLALTLITHYDAWAHAPVLKAIYPIVGATPTDGLAFDDVVMERQEKEGKTSFLLSGSITNRSSEPRIVPTVRVKLMDAKGKTLWSRDYVVKEPLKGGDVYPFRITNVDTAQGGAVASLAVDLGNSIQLMLR